MLCTFLMDEFVVRQRPVFLNLFQIRFPLTAIVSIVHRMSGMLIFLFIPCILAVLQMSIESQESFNNLQLILNNILFKVSMLTVLAAFVYHTIAGFRHVIMDFGFADSKRAARISSILVLIFSALIIMYLGVRIW